MLELLADQKCFIFGSIQVLLIEKGFFQYQKSRLIERRKQNLILIL